MSIDFEKTAQQLNNPKQEERKMALKELCKLGTDEAVILMGKTLAADRSKSVRLLAVQLLSTIDGEKAAEFFIKAIEDPEIELRKFAIAALGPIADTATSRDILLPLLENRSAEIRKAAIDAMRKCKNMDRETESRLLDVLKSRLDSPDKDERLEALTELSDFKTEEVIDLVGHKIFKDRSSVVKKRAASILAYYFGGEEVKEWLLKALAGKNIEIQKIAVHYLGTVANDDICKNVLLPLLENDAEQIKAETIAALCNRYGEMSEETRSRYVNFLENNIENPAEDIYIFSIKALLEIAPHNYIDKFIDKLAKISRFPYHLSAGGEWYYSPPQLEPMYSNSGVGLIETILKYADQAQLRKLVDILNVNKFGSLYFATTVTGVMLNVFKKTDRAGELFTVFKENLGNTTVDSNTRLWIFCLIHLLENYFYIQQATWLSDEDRQAYRWVNENLNPTIDLFKDVLAKQDKASVGGDWLEVQNFLREHETETGQYKKYRNEITRYLIPWLRLYGVDESELASLPSSNVKAKPKTKKKSKTREFKIPKIDAEQPATLDPESIQQLGTQLLMSPTALRLSAGRYLIKIDSEQVYQYMLEAIDDPTVYMRKLAWNYIAKFDTDETYHNMIEAAKDNSQEIKILAVEFLGRHPEKDDRNVLEEIIVPVLEADFTRLNTIFENYKNKRAAESLAELIIKYGRDDNCNAFFMEEMLVTFNKFVPAIAPETINPETAERLFLYLKNFYASEVDKIPFPDLERFSNLHKSLLRIIFPLSSDKLFQMMESVLAEVFVKGETPYLFSEKPVTYLQPIICLVAGEERETDQFFRLIVDNTRSGDNFQQAMGVMLLISLVGGERPGYENWGIHLDETKNLFSEILLERENLPYYRGVVDENYCPFITGEYGTGLFPFVEKAVKRARKKIKTPRKHDIFQRNLIPWLEAKEKSKSMKLKK